MWIKKIEDKWEIIGISVLLALIGFFIVVGKPQNAEISVAVMLLFYVNITVSFIQLVKAIKDYPYSFRMMFWLFSLFFFGYAALVRYKAGVYSWNLVPENNEILIANLYVLLWFVSFWCGTKWKKEIHLPAKLKKQEEREFSENRLILLDIAAIAAAAYLVYRIGIKNLFFRSTNTANWGSTMKSLLMTHGMKNLILFAAALSVLYVKVNKKCRIIYILTGLAFFIACFPTGLSRYMMAAFYVGLMILAVNKTGKGRWFAYVLVFGLVLAFPAVEIFRYDFRFHDGNVWNIIISSIKNTYLQGHYDAHQMIISIHRYVEVFGLSYGKQLLGAVLFFAPRSIWPSKPVGTGSTVITALNQYSFTNVSAPLVGEAFVNFGLVGIVFVGFILGYVIKRVDDSYWAENNLLSRTRIIYPFSMLYFFFVLRGDLMSSFAYFCANFVIGSFIYAFVFVRKNGESNL